MNKLLEIKGYLQKYYTKYSRFINKALQFILAFLTFTFIGQNIGFSEVATNPLLTIVLSLICMLLPVSMTVVFATLATLMQLYTLSAGIAIVAAILFLTMYAFYIRFAPSKSIVLLLVPIAFMFDIPVTIPIVYGLIGGPICIVPIFMGTIIYYMIHYVKSYATMLETVGEAGMMGQISTFTEQLLTSREMWCTIIALTLCLLLVYGVRRMSVDYSWEIAIVAGALGNINAMAYGYIIMDINLSYISLIIGSIVAMAIAFVLKFFVFTVDYSRTEYLQFEDDEYYYHVKAIPKASIAIPEKTVKKINERQKTGVIDAEQVKKLEKMKQREEDSEIQRIIDEELKQ